MLEQLPTGAWAFLTATVVVTTKTLTFAQCFSAFCNDVIWLIVVSFFFAKVCAAAGLQRWITSAANALSSQHLMT